MKPGDYVSGDDLADAAAGRSAGFDCAFDRADFTADDTRHQTGVDLFPADQHHVRGFHSGVSGLNHRNQAAAFNYSQRFPVHFGPSTPSQKLTLRDEKLS